MVAGVKLINMVIKKQNRKKIKVLRRRKDRTNRDKNICIERVRGRGEKE